MGIYTPLFNEIIDSSLWEEDPVVRIVFITMIIKKNRANLVRGNAYNISRWANVSEAEVLRALKILSSPDKIRMEPQPFDGRRVQKVEDGWLILNGDKYQQILAEARQRQQKADYATRQREKERAEGGPKKRRKKSKPLPGEAEYLKAVEAGATPAQLQAIEDKYAPAPGRFKDVPGDEIGMVPVPKAGGEVMADETPIDRL